ANGYVLARHVGLPIVKHLVGEDLSPKLIELGKAGLLRPGDEFIHCLGINDAAWRLIKDTGGQVAICAPIDMAMGHGLPAIPEALDHRFPPRLSSDHRGAPGQGLFTGLRPTHTPHRPPLRQRARKGGQGLPPLLSCRDLLEFGTLAGARCANLDGKVGSLTPGKEADIVMLRADRLDVWPLNNAPMAVVNMMNPGHVDTVFIAGKVKKWRGNLVGVDVPRVLRLAAEARDAVLRRAGYQA